MTDEITVRSAKVVGSDYLLYTASDSLMAYVQIGPPGWVSLGRVGEQGLLVDQSEWDRFAALVAAVSELREARRLSAEAGRVDTGLAQE